MPSARREAEPVRQSIHVDCPVEDAFRLFTEGFGEWWPLALYSLTGAEADYCTLEPWAGGRIFERTVSGEERDWGSVIAWDPPEHLRFSWCPGTREDRRQTVDVEFRIDAQGTQVTLTHTGWDTPGLAVCFRRTDEATKMWFAVLQGYFSAFVSEQALVAA